MPNRRRLRLRYYDYASAGAYFITVVARGRQCVFGDVVDASVRLSLAGQVVTTAWRRIPSHHSPYDVDAFVVMPNHVHGILVRRDVGLRGIPVPAVVGAFKGRVSRIVGRPLWQRGYHDRVIRNENELQAIREYIERNPLRWALDRENPDRLPRTGAGRVRPLREQELREPWWQQI